MEYIYYFNKKEVFFSSHLRSSLFFPYHIIFGEFRQLSVYAICNKETPWNFNEEKRNTFYFFLQNILLSHPLLYFLIVGEFRYYTRGCPMKFETR